MSTMSDVAIDLLEQYGDVVDIYYTQFLEVAFYLKVPASYEMAVGFLKKKLPQNEVLCCRAYLFFLSQ